MIIRARRPQAGWHPRQARRHWRFVTIPPLLSLSQPHLTYTAEFAQGKVDPHEAGKEGGKTSGSGGASTSGSGSGSGGSAKGGEFYCEVFELTCADIVIEFAHGKVDPHEAGKKGGQTSS
jgi:hypothetical protein